MTKFCPECGVEVEYDEVTDKWYCPNCKFREEDE